MYYIYMASIFRLFMYDFVLFWCTSELYIMLCNDPFQCGVPGQKDHQVPDTMSCNNYLKLSILICRSFRSVLENVLLYNITWFVMQFVRPTNSRFIRIIREDGREVVTIDVAITPSVVYPEGTLGRELRFVTNYQFIERMQYYVLLDPGNILRTVIRTILILYITCNPSLCQTQWCCMLKHHVVYLDKADKV